MRKGQVLPLPLLVSRILCHLSDPAPRRITRLENPLVERRASSRRAKRRRRGNSEGGRDGEQNVTRREQLHTALARIENKNSKQYINPPAMIFYCDYNCFLFLPTENMPYFFFYFFGCFLPRLYFYPLSSGFLALFSPQLPYSALL